MPESPETRRRRLRMRSWRRGMREVDLILGPFADGPLAGLEPAALDAFEALLDENDQELYRWLGGVAPAPLRHAAIIDRIRDHHRLR